MELRTSTTARLSVIPVLIALLMNLVIGPLAPMLDGGQTIVRADDVVIIQDDNTNGCNGVVSTPGSENTDKRLISGSLEPGGTATFEISYPVDPADVAGRTQFEITDCVFIDDVAVAKYFIHFVPNTENFILTFTLDIPADAPVGDEYCNYAKTTAAPSESQASNRKAGPACFLIGGDLLIHKTDAAGAPLAGATFSIACTWPTSTATLANTVITAQPDGSVSDGNDANATNDPSEFFTSTSGGSLSKSATTGSAGTIAVAAPVGSTCTFTETAPPPGGYQADPNDLSETLVVTSGAQQTHTFVNTIPPAHLTIVKDLTGETPASDWGYTGDLGGFTLPAAGGSTNAYELAPGQYTITETTKAGYDVTVSCDNGDSGTDGVTVDLASNDDVTCTFYNVAQPGSITVIKDLDGESPSSDWGYTGDLDAFALPAAGGQTTFSDLDAGTYDIAETTKDGYAVSVSCDSGETGVASVSVDLDPGEDVICTFLNVADTGITIDKSNDAEVGGEPGTVSRGDTVHFTIDVEITGNDATDVVVTDTLPDGLTYIAASADPTDGFSIAGQELTWDAGDLAIGPYTFEYDATVDDDASGTLTNLACIDADELDDELCNDSSVEVTPPSMIIEKVNDAEAPVARGSIVGYMLTVTVSDGPMNDVEVTDTLPDGLTYVVGSADPAAGFSADGQDLTWLVESLDTGSHVFTYDAIVDDDAAIGTALVNTGCVTSDDDAEDGLICDDSQVEVVPSSIDFDKSSSFDGEFVLRGETIDYTLEVTVTDGPIHNAVVFDTLADGLSYVDGSADPDQGFVAEGQDLTWTLGTLDNGTYEFTYSATVDGDATGDLPNLACIDADETDNEICDQTTVEVRIPTLVIDKVASTETITISGPANALVATPSVVTWTLSYTLTNGPVTGVVITDQVPAGFTFLDAANGGTFASGSVTWNLGTVTASGSVSFRTTVNPATISRTAPTVNTAVIDSNETAPDQGTDSVRVVVSPPPLAGNPTPAPTPKPALPNTATGIGIGGEPVTVPVELLAALFLGSLGAAALANVKARSRRR